MMRRTLQGLMLSWVAPLFACLSPIELADGSALELSVTDPALLDEIRSLVAVMYFNPNEQNPCRLLLAEDLSSLAARDPLASQAFDAHPAEDDAAGHTFGNVGASGPYTFLLLGSTRSRAELAAPPLASAMGSVIAMGCEEIEVLQGSRYDLRLTLFPVGLK